MPAKNSNPILSSHRDAATRVSTYLKDSHGIKLKPIVALEIVARVLGANNWQTLSAMAEQGMTPRPGDKAVFMGDSSKLQPVGSGPLFSEIANDMKRTVDDGKLTRITRHRTPRLLDVGSMSDVSLQADIRVRINIRGLGWEMSPVADLEAALAGAQEALGVTLAPEQSAGVRTALTEPVCVITGYAGTGKSVLVDALVRTAAAAGMRNVFNAVEPQHTFIGGVRFPKRADQFSDLLHQCIELDAPAQGVNLRECDLLIVDERVLLQDALLRLVLHKVPTSCRIVFMGDNNLLSDQHKDLGLADLVKQHPERHVRLEKQLRHKARPGTLMALEKILAQPMGLPTEQIRVDPALGLDSVSPQSPSNDADELPKHVIVITDGEPVLEMKHAPDVLPKRTPR